MKKFLYFFLVLMLCILPASAEVCYLPDTAGTQDVMVKDFFVEIGDFTLEDNIPSYDFYDYSEYDTFVCSPDDTFTKIKFDLRGVHSDFTLPITFWYEDDTSQTMTLDVNTTTTIVNYFWTYEEINLVLKDDLDNILLENDCTNFVLGEDIKVLFDPQYTYLDTGYSIKDADNSINSTVFPVRAISFDFTELNASQVNKPVCSFTYADDTLRTEFNGIFGWIYSKISKYDDSGTFYFVFQFISKMWTFVTFGADFFLTCTWSYIIMGQVFGLFYGVMQQRRGVMAMIEGYCKGTYWSLLLPVKFFGFLFTEILNLMKAIGALVPFT